MNKKGTSAVFLTLAFASMMLIVGVLIRASSSAAERSCADAVFQLAGRSVLSEYDRRLYDEYGIFGVSADEQKVTNRLLLYANASFQKNIGLAGLLSGGGKGVDLLKNEVEEIKVSLKDFSLINVDLFERQIIDYAKSNAIKSIFRPAKSKNADEGEDGRRTLRNHVVIDDLPSKGLGGFAVSISEIVEKGLPDIAQIALSGSNSYLTSEYILSRFQYANSDSENKDHFFRNEIEYILSGKTSDQDNYDSVRLKLLLLRVMLNDIHIHGDSQKMAAASGVAAAINAAGIPITPEFVAAAWAAAEAENDIRLLEEGNKVPLYKSAANWALDLDGLKDAIQNGVSSGFKNAGAVKPEKTEGSDYHDYLKLFLCLENRERRLLRAMDLIQINLKGSYDEDFLMREHYAGFSFSAKVNGESYAYTQTYSPGEYPKEG
ncbi:MAG: DUF5702 domain-containing protein [Clostridiales Family XIII bacterium]|nr:DUF5702 domain-containing protein [Clostridiales Family XIII bacterium]